MSTFTQFNSLLQKERTNQDFNQPLRKQVKLNQINAQQIHFEDETITLTHSTNILMMKLNKSQIKQDKIVQDQLGSLNFLSLRERFDTNNINYPLPKKFTALLERMKTFEWNLWKKKQLLIDPEKFMIDFIQLRQLLAIQGVYTLMKKQNKFELKFPKPVIENLGPFQEGPLPQILKNRVQTINNLLDRIVQRKHSEYLKKHQLEGFAELQNQLKIYHPDFDIEDIEDIELLPLEWTFNIQEKNQFKEFVIQMWKYYEIRNVNFVFFINLINQMKLRVQQQEKEEIERKIQFLIKLLPDAIQITNMKSQSDREKWIIQINKKLSSAEVLERIEKLLK